MKSSQHTAKPNAIDGALTSLPTGELSSVLVGLQAISPLLDALSDTVFFVKDTQARYVFVNRTLTVRCGFKQNGDLYGLTAEMVFPKHFGPVFTEQDRKVLAHGQEFSDQLELHLNYGNEPVWCLTRKHPLRDNHGKIVGLAGISQDLQRWSPSHPSGQKMAAVDEYIRTNFASPIKIAELCGVAKLSVSQLERHCKQLFGLTPQQLIQKARLGEASRLLLKTQLPITDVALQCGYTDHSAFSRKFRSLTGLAPSHFRETQNGYRVDWSSQKTIT